MPHSTDLRDRYFTTAQEDRCAPRIKLRISATLRASGCPAFSVIVTDLSLAGFSCEAVTGIPKNAVCWLTLPGMMGLQAEVIWNSGQFVGCAFADLLNGAVLESIIARHA